MEGQILNAVNAGVKVYRLTLRRMNDESNAAIADAYNRGLDHIIDREFKGDLDDEACEAAVLKYEEIVIGG